MSQTGQDSLAPFYGNLFLEHMQKANKLEICGIPVFLPSKPSAEDYRWSTCRTLSSLFSGYRQFSDRLSLFDTVVMYHQIHFSLWLSMPELM